MPLPLLGGGREGVFHASLTQPHSLFTLAIAKILRAPPPFRGGWEGVFHASLTKPHSLFTLAIVKMLHSPPPFRGRTGGGISRQPYSTAFTLYVSDSENASFPSPF